MKRVRKCAMTEHAQSKQSIPTRVSKIKCVLNMAATIYSPFNY